MANGFRSLLSLLLSTASLALALSLVPAMGEDEKDAPARRVGIVFEGSFETVEVSRNPEGAELTQMVPFHEWEYGVRPFTKELWTERGFTWERFLPIARRVADDLVENLKPELVRGPRGVVEYAFFDFKDPFLTSILISDKLLDKFRDTLGDRVHVIVVDRHLIYFFPATGSKLNDYGPAIVDEFDRSPLPVSLEVFLLDKKGLRAVGELERELRLPE